MKNTGKPSEKIFEQRLALLGKRAYFYRIKDAATIKGLTGKVGNVGASPSDYFIVLDGKTSFAEVKSTQEKTSFPFSLLKKGQVAHGIQINNAGGNYYVYIHNLNSDKWYRVPFGLIEASRNLGKSSLTWESLQTYVWN